ncbi:MAG: ECF-type sigma factor [Pseudomonadota bacterium]
MKQTQVKGSSALPDKPSPSSQMVEAVYNTLRTIARRERKRNPSKTLNTTLLVHEAWIKLGAEQQQWNNERHCLATYALAIRQVLVDYVRSSLSKKRSPNEDFQNFQIDALGQRTGEELLAIDQALNQLQQLDPRLAKLVELRFFIGLSNSEIADYLGVSVRTVVRDWNRARSFLQAYPNGSE